MNIFVHHEYIYTHNTTHCSALIQTTGSDAVVIAYSAIWLVLHSRLQWNKFICLIPDPPCMQGSGFATLGVARYSADCYVSIIFQPGFVCCLSSARLIPSQGRSFPVNILLLCHCTTCCAIEYKYSGVWTVLVWCKCNFICCALYFMSQITVRSHQSTPLSTWARLRGARSHSPNNIPLENIHNLWHVMHTPTAQSWGEPCNQQQV